MWVNRNIAFREKERFGTNPSHYEYDPIESKIKCFRPCNHRLNNMISWES